MYYVFHFEAPTSLFFHYVFKDIRNGGDLRMSLEMFGLVTIQDRLIIRKSLIRAFLQYINQRRLSQAFCPLYSLSDLVLNLQPHEKGAITPLLCYLALLTKLVNFRQVYWVIYLRLAVYKCVAIKR